jgi:hypothetical protein
MTGAAFADDQQTRMERRDARLADQPVSDFDFRANRDMKVPFIYDGVEFPAGSRLPEHQLTFVLTAEDHAKGTIHVFSSRELAKVFVDRDVERVKNGAGVGTDGVRDRVEANSCTWNETYSWFNTAVGCGNPGVLTLVPFDSYSNLDFGGWNNTISCVKAACIGYYTVLYACRDFQTYNGGSCSDADSLWVYPGAVITDLNSYNFNNRTSSIQFQ